MKKTVLFQGDSITDCDRLKEDSADLGCGYARITAMNFENEPLKFINRGVNGDRVCHLRVRWQKDCIDLKPDVVSIAIGVNEVLVKLYEGFYTPADEYERDYRYIIGEIKSKLPGAKIIMVQPFVQVISDEMRMLREHLPPITAITDRLASEFADYYIPLGRIFDACVDNGYSPRSLALDGIHPTPLGHHIYSCEMTKAVAQMTKTKE